MRSVALVQLFAVLAWPVAVAQVDPALLGGLRARSLGPAGMSGRIGAIDAVASDPNVIYVGAATGGLWKSTTGGVTWTPLLDSLPAPSIGAIAVFQANPDVVWVGTGEKGRRNSAGVGTGVYKSLDAGATWSLVGLEATGAVAEIILHPDDPAVAYVAALGNTWLPGPDRGVYKTSDGGATWRKVLYVNETTGAADLVMDPVNPDKLFVAMWEHRRWPWFFTSGGPGSGLHVTHDGGATWRRLTPDDGLPEGELGRIGLDVARSDPSVVYALVEATRSVLVRSTDGGRTWKTVNRERGVAPRPFYYAQVRVDPDNANRVYNVHSLIELSEDGGKSFETLLPFARVHPDHHAFWINPLDGRFIVDGNDGGVYISRDRGRGWRFVENLPLAQFYHINVDMETPFNVYGGLQDNGSWRGPSAVWETGGIRNYHWQEVGFGDGFATLSDPTNPRYGYAMSQGGNLMRFDKHTGERKAIRPVHPEGIDLRFNWNAGIALDPFDGAVYYGSQFLHRTTDMGHSWTLASPDLTTNDPEKQRQRDSGGLTYDVTAAENHTTIITIAPSPVERGVIWVGTDDGNVQVTRDSGATWTSVAGRIRNVPSGTWVPHIEASKSEGGTAYVVLDDHRRGNHAAYVYRTTDYGRSFTRLATDGIEGFVHVIEEDPVEPALLYLGTEFGMYVSLDGGRRWHLWRHGLPRAPVRALIVHPRDHDLVIGTHGRSAYVLDDVRPLRALARDPTIQRRSLYIFTIAAAIQYQPRQPDGYRFLADGMFVGENRPYGALITYTLRDGSDTLKATIEVLDDAGTVVRTFTGPAQSGLNRTAWDLRRDGFRRPRGEEERAPGAFSPPAPDVLPGVYRVRLSTKGERVEQLVEVLPDPRFDIPLAERREKVEAVMRLGRRQATAVEAIDRLREAQKGLATLREHLDGDDDGPARALRRGADSLEHALTRVQHELTEPEDVQGIRGDPDAVMSRLGSLYRSLSSSRDRPTESQWTALRQLEERLEDALAQVNRVLAEDVAAFRERVRALGLQLFPEHPPLTLGSD